MTSRHSCGVLWLNCLYMRLYFMYLQTWRHATAVAFCGLILFKPIDTIAISDDVTTQLCRSPYKFRKHSLFFCSLQTSPINFTNKLYFKYKFIWYYMTIWWLIGKVPFHHKLPVFTRHVQTCFLEKLPAFPRIINCLQCGVTWWNNALDTSWDKTYSIQIQIIALM